MIEHSGRGVSPSHSHYILSVWRKVEEKTYCNTVVTSTCCTGTTVLYTSYNFCEILHKHNNERVSRKHVDQNTDVD